MVATPSRVPTTNLITGCWLRNGINLAALFVFLALTEVRVCSGILCFLMNPTGKKNLFKGSFIFHIAPSNEHTSCAQNCPREIPKKYATTQSNPIHAAQQRRAFLAGIMCGVPINASPRGLERTRGMQCDAWVNQKTNERSRISSERTKPHFVISCDIGFVPSFVRIGHERGREGERGRGGPSSFVPKKPPTSDFRAPPPPPLINRRKRK